MPLGGTRAMLVRRTLPHRDLPTVGAWCFADDYGPTEVAGRRACMCRLIRTRVCRR